MLRLRVTACHPWGSPTIVTFGGPQELARQLAKGTMVGPQGWRWNQLWLPFGLTASHNLLHGGATRWPGRKTLGNEFPPSSGGPTMGGPEDPRRRLSGGNFPWGALWAQR